MRNRELLSEAVQKNVRDGRRTSQAMDDLGLPPEDANAFRAMLERELEALTPYNCARYRIAIREAQGWIAGGRLR